MGVKPNSVTLLGLLLACSHVGLVDEAYSYFEQARTQDANLLKSEHYACMVDLLSRSGRNEMREKGLKTVPGCSWVEIKCKIHVFVTGDKRHAHKAEIYELLGAVSTQ
ncbi:hypothetical protein HAX54_002847 [Datura stramonium]|uniref:Pentatricopeptide repeat-containing protein n=1 Tax=Datura stramonium TaxID=4076 RepID=A0ABS8T6N7_DATST|nr:hypothetical protein [Datura stramonium]